MEVEFGKGMRYRDEDYASFFLRVVILVVDLGIVFSVMTLGVFIDGLIYDNSTTYDSYYALYLTQFLAFIYLTLVKISKFGTLGQILTKTRVETIYGTKPSLFRMTFRLFFWLLGPTNLVVDFLFLTMIKEKRTVKDCICNTIVVKRSAMPVETDMPIHVTRVFALGMNLMYESCNDKSI